MKTRHEISEDELVYREMLKDHWKREPGRRAVKHLQNRIEEVLKRLGVDVDKDEESVKMQMEIMDIFINALPDEVGSAAGLYFSAPVNGTLAPYAWISTAKAERGHYMFPIVYWGKEGGRGDKLDEGKEEKIIA